MTVTPTGGTQQTVPAAIAARVLGDANGKVRPSRLEIGNMAANLCPNGDMEDVAGGAVIGWGVLAPTTAGSTISATTTTAYAGTTSLLLTKTTADANSSVASVGSRMPVEPQSVYGGSVFAAAIANASASGLNISIFWYDKNDTFSSTTPIFVNLPIPLDWTERPFQVRAPAGVSFARIGIYNTAASTAQSVAVDAVVFRRASGATGIEDAAITPLKLYAPTRGQFFRALENSGAGRVATVTDAVPSDRGDAINIAFNHTTFVTQAGALAQFVKTTLSLTDAQLAAIITAARSVAE
ncbi:hypothetical protein [Methylobacterium sp. R2-1]|uniref:hypothetical protein n=1 Tax=Methylobacterium sp. R2-1 TaxID=2587064 RepID=UPI00160A3253|nr:hypothetical protein [Methylobacterium sp. R2-1]MBB2959843.1 hypothetical protein [Methylobacterium sp. R2-1]